MPIASCGIVRYHECVMNLYGFLHNSTFNLDPADIEWVGENPRSCGLTTLNLCVGDAPAVNCHLEFIAVREDAAGNLVAVEDHYDNRLQQALATYSDSGFQTVTIDGWDYVAIMVPFDR